MNEVVDTPSTRRAMLDAFAGQAEDALYGLFGGIYALQDMAKDERGERLLRAEGVEWLAKRLLADANRVLTALDRREEFAGPLEVPPELREQLARYRADVNGSAANTLGA